MWSFFPEQISLTTGTVIQDGMIQFAWGGDKPDDNYKNDLDLSNHMSSQKNKQWAKKIEALI